MFILIGNYNFIFNSIWCKKKGAKLDESKRFFIQMRKIQAILRTKEDLKNASSGEFFLF